MCKRMIYVTVSLVILLVITSFVSADLVAHWPLDESAGSVVNDVIGNAGGGLLAGDAEFVVGHFMHAVSFDGDGDGILWDEDNDLLDPGSGGMAVTAWLNQGDGTSSHAYEFVVSKGNRTSGMVGWSIWTEGDSLLVRCNADGTSSQRASQKIADFPLNEWHHVADANSVMLSWTPGFGAKLHTVYFGEDYDQVNEATMGVSLGSASYSPDSIEREKVYYWRVDEFDGVSTYKGDVWTFTTPGAVGRPLPATGAVDVAMATVLNWIAAENVESHQIYLGLDKDIVRSADTSSPEYKGSMTLGAESYDAGLLEADTMYYWRVDAINNDSPVKGPIWNFTTGAYLLVEDFESYTDDDAAGEAIWQHWIDGFGVADNGAQVGYLMPPYAEQTIVHGGSQSMPLYYTNQADIANSEAVLTLTDQRDWTTGDVGELSLWFRGATDNATEPLYVAISNSNGTPAIVANDDQQAAQSRAWTQWTIPLQSVADQGIDLINVDKIAIGLGSKGGASAGGIGTMFIDDIRLNRLRDIADQ